MALQISWPHHDERLLSVSNYFRTLAKVWCGTLIFPQSRPDAIERQEEVIKQMQLILELLMSEDRRDEIDKEKARIRDLMKDLDKLIGKQTDARANTERGADSNELLKEQK